MDTYSKPKGCINLHGKNMREKLTTSQMDTAVHMAVRIKKDMRVTEDGAVRVALEYVNKFVV